MLPLSYVREVRRIILPFPLHLPRLTSVYRAMAQVSAFAHEKGLKLHLDGARLFNAAVAEDTSAAELVEPYDSVGSLHCPLTLIILLK